METTFDMKSRTRFGTWNIRTMLETSRLAQVIHEMDRYRLQVLGLCETRWSEQGEHITSDGHMLLFSGKPTNEPHASGVVLMDDFNAKVGQNNNGLEHVMGAHALGQMNNNGELLTEFCSTQNLIIGGSIFPHKDIHKATISKMWRGSLLDVRARRGADVASDHHLVTGAMRIEVAKYKAKTNIHKRKHFATEKLKDPKYKDAFVTESVIGFKERNKAVWLTSETWNLINRRREQKQQILNAKTLDEKDNASRSYMQLNKQVKRRARNDKRKWVESLADKAQIAAESNKPRELYTITRTLANKNNIRNYPPQNSPARPPQYNVTDERTLPGLSDDPPTLAEIKKAIRNLKNNKAAGVNGIPSELLKADINLTANLYQPIIKDMWENEELPDGWDTGLIVKLPKKGDLKNCENWRVSHFRIARPKY
ncbi:uncharacterized protein LOC112458024 [Temnothorax curvispinosus]|uniref:Uncharacterized protein LOC112458024 n=1 Tax=Temnothorax curvispinosus TaxID=300111 RepID=A0A6J1Q8I6_9HYME|nr:uncharacterized protein LOC112458024 [Temnothorax curvispinosus]